MARQLTGGVPSTTEASTAASPDVPLAYMSAYCQQEARLLRTLRIQTLLNPRQRF